MKYKKYIKAGLIAVFLILTGVIYSCQRAGSNQQSSTLGTPINLAEGSSPESQTDLQAETQKETGEAAEEIQEQESAPQQETQIYYVHLCGAVRNPGVYEATKATRVYELVQSAGGFTKEADENYVNQAANVEDGQQIYIPTREEVQKGSEKVTLTGRNSTASPDNAGEDTNKTGKVNINTATKSELCTLPGIGEVKAGSIIDYRTNHGEFQSIEELKQIEGIKDAVYNKIKDMIEAK
ncbi:helix-hairpin-helix domain-containing protein [Clostridium sp. KNHs205]|uniref:helix-hairpin-helix domain-containing protein n=1 Tax=Clostridium sp. KNHs205 TaxID=1449050 RepID=UPI0006903BBF|nr:helix-hairpin-helix domain-containing protein [Clostridium sp. KNHs205]